MFRCFRKHARCRQYTNKGASESIRSNLEACGFGEVDPEPFPPALIAAGHLGAGMAQVLLHVALIDLG